MDPTANLREQRELATRISATPVALRLRPGTVEELVEAGQRLAELVTAYDEWRSRGGFEGDAAETPPPGYAPIPFDRAQHLGLAGETLPMVGDWAVHGRTGLCWRVSS